MEYRYYEEFYMIEYVKMELVDNTGEYYKILMKYNDSEKYWYCQCHLDVVRYKFVVNNIIRLNDPFAREYVSDDKWEVWSVPGQCRGDLPRLITYNISNCMNNGVKNAVRKVEYIYDKIIDIYVGVDIGNVKELHSLTCICFQPDGSIYALEESSMGVFEQKEEDYEIIFKNRIVGMEGRHAEGIWNIQIYLDGRLIIKEYIALKTRVVTDMILLNKRI